MTQSVSSLFYQISLHQIKIPLPNQVKRCCLGHAAGVQRRLIILLDINKTKKQALVNLAVAINTEQAIMFHFCFVPKVDGLIV